MSVQAIARKQDEVKIITDKMLASPSTIVTTYSGLTVEEFKDLRNQLRAEGVEIKVLKNNISSRSAEAAKFEEMKELFVGPTAVAFSAEDATVGARIIKDFSKEHPAMTIKGGIVEGKYLNEVTMNEIASLPSKDGLISMFLSVLQAPIRNMAYATSQVASQKPAEAAPVAEVKEEVKEIVEETPEVVAEDAKTEVVEEVAAETVVEVEAEKAAE